MTQSPNPTQTRTATSASLKGLVELVKGPGVCTPWIRQELDPASLEVQDMFKQAILRIDDPLIQSLR